ncbi:hypothetical protein PVK06_022040 [Gossypium arboreum]|uniref:Uncharacterized protein n=1 Tax=Gossypium arboreum TaxID=29729 RepID=A0ABR0P7B5_GOSAR|nr:hypothetical protein PVK06_022040 [Gossypium arboreum]
MSSSSSSTIIHGDDNIIKKYILMHENDDKIDRHHGYISLAKGDKSYDHAPPASVDGDGDDDDLAPAA